MSIYGSVRAYHVYAFRHAARIIPAHGAMQYVNVNVVLPAQPLVVGSENGYDIRQETSESRSGGVNGPST